MLGAETPDVTVYPVGRLLEREGDCTVRPVTQLELSWLDSPYETPCIFLPDFAGVSQQSVVRNVASPTVVHFSRSEGVQDNMCCCPV